MALFFLIIYILILILNIVLIVRAFRNKTKKHWINMFIVECISVTIALLVMLYHDSLPGYGVMPGFSYLGEILFSYVAMILYTVCLIVSLLGCLIINVKK
ncbi:MAG: hypothetical protein IJA34_07675 [Lachnospiraceae bacterium]|nr:hypothetical protein [Lachnospiraceae bacterium]